MQEIPLNKFNFLSLLKQNTEHTKNRGKLLKHDKEYLLNKKKANNKNTSS